MNIIDILKGIENLAVEVLLWLIYIPKTIFKIIKDPNWVPGYVRDELSKNDKFKGYMSPVLLFLGISIILFVLLDTGVLTTPDYNQKGGSFSDRIQDAIGLLFLGIPLFFALFTEIFRKGGVKRETVLLNLYVQCYYLSPVMLSLFAFLLADQFDWESTGTFENVAMIPGILFSLTLLWFIFVQVKFISRELKYNKVISLGIVLIWVIVMSGGYYGYDILFSPAIVDQKLVGEVEKLEMTLPSDGEFSIDVYNYSDGSSNDYVISIQNKNNKGKPGKDGFSLIHNQTFIDSLDTQLRFWFNGKSGEEVLIMLKNVAIEDQNSLSLWTKNQEKNLFFDSEDKQTDIWMYEPFEEENAGYISIRLPETGKYHLEFLELSKSEEKYSIGFYNYALDGVINNEDFAHISYGNSYKSGPLDESLIGFNKWKFRGNAGDKIEINVTPGKIDVGFDIYDSTGKSVVPIDRTDVANVIHWLYVIFFGYIIFIGFRAFFRNSGSPVVLNENAGSKTGRILAIVGLVYMALAILLFIFMI